MSDSIEPEKSKTPRSGVGHAVMAFLGEALLMGIDAVAYVGEHNAKKAKEEAEKTTKVPDPGH